MLVPIPGLRGRAEQPVLISLAFEIRFDFLHLAAFGCERHLPDPLSPLLHRGTVRRESMRERGSAVPWCIGRAWEEDTVDRITMFLGKAQRQQSLIMPGWWWGFAPGTVSRARL